MEIYNEEVRRSIFNRLKTRGRLRRILALLLIVIGLGGFAFGFIVYGAYLQNTGQTSLLRMFLIRGSQFDFSFIPKNIKSRANEVNEFAIDVKFKNWERLRYYREQVLSNGMITPEFEQEVPAKIRFNGHTYSVDISLTGMETFHVRHPYKWSLSVKVKRGETIMGMRRFAILFPQARGYLTDWIGIEMLKSQNLIGLRTDFVNVTINGQDNGLYYLEERFDKRLIEHNQFREGIIFKLEDTELKIYGLNKIAESEEFSSQLIFLKSLIQSFLAGEIEAEKIFDMKKMATLFVVSDLLCQKNPVFRTNLRMYFNPVTSLIEPIGREWAYLRRENMLPTNLSIEKPNPEVAFSASLGKEPILQMIINSFAFEEEYIKQAVILSDPIYLDSLVAANELTMNELLGKIHKQNPFYVFPIDMIHEYQEYIRSKIYRQEQSINVFYKHLQNDSLYLSVENIIDLPIEIHYLTYNSKTEILPANRVLIESNFKSSEAYENVSFRLSNDIGHPDFSSDSLEVHYSILGTNKIIKTIVFPKEMQKVDYENLNPTTQTDNTDEFPFLIVNDESRTIQFSSGKCDVSKDIVIPDGYFVSANPGSQIDLTNSSKIISYSPILFFGNSDNPISITSSDSTGQGIIVLNCEETSELSYVNFRHLSNMSDGGWNLPGAIVFYESPVNINNCRFSNNLRGDDYLNIIRSDFNLLNTTFEYTMADALDSDFCTGTLENVKFDQVGNDAIDVSGTELFISKIDITNAGDKGISGGEGSNLICENVSILGGEIAVASKDNTTVSIDGISIDSSKLGYCAFQKKSEYGPGSIIIKNSTLKNVHTDYLIEVGSSLSIDGKQINKKSDNVNDLLYGAEYGKSS